jgi:adenylate cyclase
MNNADEINKWLMSDGRLLGDLALIVEGYVERLIDAGVPLSRVNIGQRFANPLLIAWGIVWTPEETNSYDVAHTIMGTNTFVGGPFHYVLKYLKPLQKSLLNLDPENDHSIYLELAESGGTDMFATYLTYGDGSEHGCTYVVNHPDGFRDEHVALIQETRAGLACALEPIAMRKSLTSLLQTYLGDGPAKEVHSGTIQRGDHRRLEAVIMFTDLRGFTQKTETWEEEKLLAALNDYFEVVVQAVENRSGDVLKFMGDGILSIFPFESSDHSTERCREAIEAARDAITALERLNQVRARAGEKELAMGIGLNRGAVTYGNIGSPGRLDFTVLGPAVNLASRVQDLCKTVGDPVLSTGSVADARIEYFETRGHHEVRGLEEPVEVFALKL